MPNWVFTSMTVKGDAKKVAEFREKARQPYKTQHNSPFTNEREERVKEGPLLLWNFIEPEDKEAYHSDDETDGWYAWNNRNWGTKWDVSAELEQDEPELLEYRFDTAWAPAEGAFVAMVKQHPDLHFYFFCEEEQGWGVEYESSDGELVTVQEWDIPEHEEREET